MSTKSVHDVKKEILQNLLDSNVEFQLTTESNNLEVTYKVVVKK